MINTDDQESLLTLIANYLEKDITCMAIGGTAMMFKGYKTATKDIDLVFQNIIDRDVFMKALKEIGYSQKSLKLVYDEKREQDKNKPLLFSKGDERFDLFVKNVFGIPLDMKNFDQRHDFIGKQELIILTPSKETLILMKSITNREKDFEDIEDIIGLEKNIDWETIVDEAVRNKANKWILIDLEETMQKLKEKTLIKKKFFDRIYNELN